MSRPRDWATLARSSPSVLARLQDEFLSRFVREELYPFSRHYRGVFDAAGVSSRDVRCVDDLRRLPFTTKADLLASQTSPETKRDFIMTPTPALIRTHWPLARKLALVLGGARARERLRYQYTPNFVTFTTGRSSEPVAVTYTPHDLDILGEATARIFDLMEIVSPEDRVVNMMPFAPHLAFWAVTLGGFRSGRLVLPSGGGKVLGTAGNLRMIERFGATALVGTPGYVYHMIRQGREEGADLSSVETIVLGAEKVPPGMKVKMSEALQACGAGEVTIAGTYGFTEARMAFSECPTQHDESSGYHLFPDLGVFEIVDPESGEPAGDGQDGEIVYTGIGGHGSAVLRYRTGDLAIGGMTREPCPFCGRTVPRISSELRRLTDRHALNLTKIKGTLVDLSHIGTVLAEMPGIEEWQVVLSKKEDDPFGLDELEVRFCPRGDLGEESLIPSIRTGILNATEVAPNRISNHSLPEMLEFLGMETEMKEKRYLDRRP